MTSTPNVTFESPKATLATNLVIARQAAGITQRQLADASRISRATIAQLETGCGDPRLTTIVELARALQIPPILLLVGAREARLLVHLTRHTPDEVPQVSQPLIQNMRELAESGFIRDRLRAARLGASAVAAQGLRPASISAAIFSSVAPGPGTVVGAALGRLIAHQQKEVSHVY
ncbi:MAG: helix-turn-helix transcriptional regulator [Tepidisphaeraceae bacterium]|jgi:transcriptional regulator with XRE-family HTH domain